MKKLFCILCAALGIASCKNGSVDRLHVQLAYNNGNHIPGTNDPKKTDYWVYLEQVVYGKDVQPLILDSQKMGGVADILKFNCTTTGEGIFELVVGNNLLAIPLIKDVPEIQVNADFSKSKDFYTVAGSPASKQLQTLLTDVGTKNNEIQSAFNELDSLKKASAPDSMLVAANDRKNTAITQLNDYLKQFIHTTMNPTLGVLALGWASRSFPPAEMDSALKNLKNRFPGNAFLAEMEKASSQPPPDQSSTASWVGKTVPELTMPDVNGKEISISSFRGKYVLIDFWASWCGPCRMENPNVVKAFEAYKGKNFTILGVSLDKEKDAWKKAIEQDHLSWTQMSDLKYWNSQAVEVFGFQGIPFNVLVDPSGRVIGESLRGEELEAKLKTVLN